MRHTGWFRASLVALLAVGVVLSTAALASADVRTDRFDYAAGDTVAITGDGMQAGEAVGVDVTYPDGSLGQHHDVQADGAGEFTDSYTLPDDAPGGIYGVTATGESSGAVFTTSFDPIGNGALNCPTLAVHNPTHYKLPVGSTVTCTIDGASEVSGQSTTPVIIQSSALGNTTLTGSVSGTGSATQITFTFTAPQNGCDTTAVSYKQLGLRANNSVINTGGHAGAGLAYVDGSGDVVACGGSSPPNIETAPNHSTISPGDSVTDTATLTGSDGAVTGTVTFFVCGPSGSPPDCSTGGTQVGNAVTISGGQATSDAFTPGTDPSANGTYCFRAEYAPDQSANYVVGSHTDTQTECFTQDAAGIDVEKVADATPVSPNDQIGFLITVTSTGPGTARDVQLSDPLPTTPGTSWSVDSGTGAGFCNVNLGTLECSFGDMASGASYTVHITSPTTAASMGDITNTAYVTTSNAGDDQDSDTIHVFCPDVRITVRPDATPVTHGGQIGFKLTLTGLHKGVNYGVTLSNKLPKGHVWTIDPTSSPGCSISLGMLNCSFGNIGTNQKRIVHITTGTRKVETVIDKAVVNGANMMAPVKAQGTVNVV